MKIAWFTPFSTKSAIGEYSRRITKRLSQLHDVDLWLADDEDLKKTELRIINYSKTPEILDHLSQYDVIVYNLGDHLQFHKKIYETSIRYKGIVILHDLVLHHFFAGYYLMHKKDPRTYIEQMGEFYGKEGMHIAQESVIGKKTRIWECDDQILSYPLFEMAIVNAEGVVVHSQYHDARVKTRYSGPIRVIYHPCYDNELPMRALESNLRHHIAYDFRLLLVTIGHVTPNKQIDKIIQVLACNRDIAKKVRYVVIGPYDEGSEYFKGVKALIERYSLERSVEFLGYQPDGVLSQYLSNADIFINLRLPAMEGASWSVVEELLTGKPVIVFDTGFFSELPGTCVVKLPPGNYEALAERLRALVASEALRDSIGARGRGFAMVRFSVERYVTEFSDFLEEVRSWRPVLALTDRVSEDLALMGVDGGMKVLNAVATEIYQLFRRGASIP